MKEHSLKTMTAHEIASDNYSDNKFSFTSSANITWECMGYSRNGNSILFSRLKILDDGKLKQINIYVSPNRTLYVWKI